MEGTLIMTDQDRKRYGRAVEVIEGRMDMETASRLVGLRRRQMARIVARVRQAGARGVQHRLRSAREDARGSRNQARGQPGPPRQLGRHLGQKSGRFH